MASPGARETVLPGNAVVDLTGSFYRTRERSRLPVDDLSGEVDILIDPSGRVVPTISYSSPSGNIMGQSTFYHIWVGERSDLAELPAADADGNRRLVSGYDFALPMPVDAYPASVLNANPTLPQLKGEMRLLTLFTRTGNLMTTDRPPFNVSNTNQPFHAAELGEQGDAP